MNIFRELYPEGKNLVICPYVSEAYIQNMKGYSINFCPIEDIAEIIQKKS